MEREKTESSRTVEVDRGQSFEHRPRDLNRSPSLRAPLPSQSSLASSSSSLSRHSRLPCSALNQQHPSTPTQPAIKEKDSKGGKQERKRRTRCRSTIWKEDSANERPSQETLPSHRVRLPFSPITSSLHPARGKGGSLTLARPRKTPKGIASSRCSPTAYLPTSSASTPTYPGYRSSWTSSGPRGTPSTSGASCASRLSFIQVQRVGEGRGGEWKRPKAGARTWEGRSGGGMGWDGMRGASRGVMDGVKVKETGTTELRKAETRSKNSRE